MTHIYVCSPSMPVDDTDIADPTPCLEKLKNLGFEVSFSAHALDDWGDVSSPIATRVSDIHEGFTNPEYNVVMASTGGWCSNEILPFLDYDLISRYPKPFIGLSDITTLCLNLWQKANIPTIYGLNLQLFGKDTPLPDFWQFKEVLANPHQFSGFTREPIQDSQIYRSGRMSGALVGGNLDVMCWLTGTPFAPKIPDGAIFFLENDQGSNGYNWQMELTHLKQAGVFENISGLVFGKTGLASLFKKKSSFKDILDLAIDKYKFPVLIEADFGHIPNSISIPLGVQYELTI